MKPKREFHRAVEALGWEVAGATRGGHIKLRRRSDGRTYATGMTPSDHRSMTKLLADLRRMNRGDR